MEKMSGYGHFWKWPLNKLCQLPGISLVIASKIFRFCAPQIGAAVDRHSSYFFNSLPIVGYGLTTRFSREWANGGHTASRLANFNETGYARNRDQYIQSYLPILASISSALNETGRQYRCAATGQMESWNPADIEMAAYYYWARHGAR